MRGNRFYLAVSLGPAGLGAGHEAPAIGGTLGAVRGGGVAATVI